MYLAAILFAAGLMLVVLEVFLPSFGLLTVGALCCFGLSVWQAYAGAGPAAAWIMGVVAPVLTVFILYYGLKYMPRSGWGRGLVLFDPADEGATVPATSTESSALSAEGGTDEDELKPLIGKEGVAQSDLRPAGVALIGGSRLDVVTEGSMIDAGGRVKVIAVEGNRVVVRRVRV